MSVFEAYEELRYPFYCDCLYVKYPSRRISAPSQLIFQYSLFFLFHSGDLGDLFSRVRDLARPEDG
jgi:hypothetical protein